MFFGLEGLLIVHIIEQALQFCVPRVSLALVHIFVSPGFHTEHGISSEGVHSPGLAGGRPSLPRFFHLSFFFYKMKQRQIPK